MKSVSVAEHVIVWGVLPSADLTVIGTIAIDRAVTPWTYTAGAGPEQATFASEAAAAQWLALRAVEYPVHVFIGHTLRVPYVEWVENQPTAHDRPGPPHTLGKRATLALLGQ